MKLVSFGCSFIYGNDLYDCNTNFAKNVFGSLDPGFYEGRSSNLTWPALAAKELGLVYECRAEGGSSNLKILDQIIENAHTNPDSIYIINWTWIDRFSYVNSEGDTWHNILPSSSGHNAKMYYRNFHSTYTDKLNTLLYIKSAIDLLTSKNIPYVMTYMDPLMLESVYHVSPTIKFLQDFVKPVLTTFDGLSFLEWSAMNNFVISDNLHPLDDAHRAAADNQLPIIISRIQNIIDR